MTAGGLVVAAPQRPPRKTGGQGTSLRIVCPTYWYPQHATDTQATYVHDINRHLVRRGHSVTVVTPGDRSLARADTFDGVRIGRGLGCPPAWGAQRDHHARWRCLCESGAGVRLPHPLVCAACPALDAAARR